jgi:hypothetical protein
MESFSADWLALREPADHASRAHALTAQVAGHLRTRVGVRAIDLAAGSGSNVRYLLPRLPEVTHWTLVDHDPALLARASRLLTPVADAAGRAFEVRQGDLRDLAALPLESCALVTGSALLDLVSETWMRAFARRCREARVEVLCALSYDGRIVCEPPDGDDRLVRDLVNRHQQTDKGFGVALGPDAARVAADCFRDEGFEVQTTESDWVLDDSHAELQRQLLEGWAGAARAMSPQDAPAVDAWLTRRLAHLAAGASRVRVGHVDLVASTR